MDITYNNSWGSLSGQNKSGNAAGAGSNPAPSTKEKKTAVWQRLRVLDRECTRLRMEEDGWRQLAAARSAVIRTCKCCQCKQRNPVFDQDDECWNYLNKKAKSVFEIFDKYDALRGKCRSKLKSIE